MAGMPKPSLQGRIHGAFPNRPPMRARVVTKKERWIRCKHIGATLAVSLSTLAALPSCQQDPFRNEEYKPPIDSGKKLSRGMSGSCGGRWEGRCGGRMEGMMMGAPTQPSSDPAQLPDRNSEGSRLLSKYCTQCHGLPDPARHSAAGWPPVVARMIRRMKWVSNNGTMTIETPGESELKTLNDYLQKHARK